MPDFVAASKICRMCVAKPRRVSHKGQIWSVQMGFEATPPNVSCAVKVMLSPPAATDGRANFTELEDLMKNAKKISCN
jgi:hypothetical protein